MLLSVGMIILLPRLNQRRIGGFLCLALCLGYLLSGHAAHPFLPPEGEYRLEGIAAQDMQIREDGKVSGYLEDVSLQGEEGEYSLSRLYWTYVPEEENIFLPLEGQKISFQGYVYHPSGRTNPYGLDFRLFLLQKGVAAGVSGADEAVILSSPSRGAASLFYQARKALTRQIQLIFGEGSALPEALLVGVRENLPEEMTESFSKAGVAHILSVSGLHVALLAGALLFPLRSLLSPGKRFSVLALFLLGYLALLDFAAPAVRASILLLAANFRRVIRRAPDEMTILSAAFLLILLLRPLDLFSGSFILSFSAVLGIALYKEMICQKLFAGRKTSLLEGLAVTFSANLGVALPTIQLFHHLSLIGLLINPIVCVAFEFLLPAYAMVMILGCLYLPFGQILAVPLNFIGARFTEIISWIGELPFVSLQLPSLPAYIVIALVILLLLFSRYTLLSAKKRLIAGACIFAVSFGAWHGLHCRDVQYIQLNMGQADCALILDGKETWIIDTGEHGGDLSSYLQATGRKADKILLTHLHTDHCLGIRELLKDEIEIGAIYLPEGAESQDISDEAKQVMEEIRKREIPVFELAAGDTLESGRIRCLITWPYAETVHPGMEGNRYSMATLWDLDGVSLLSMSDVPGIFEEYAMQDADILKIAHHGSKNSTGENFLKAVSPALAICTSSADSPYHPHPETKERLAKSGVSVYNTGETGAVTLRMQDGSVLVTTFLKGGMDP